jgi:Alpha galactosidase A
MCTEAHRSPLSEIQTASRFLLKSSTTVCDAAGDVGNSWRTSRDISKAWQSVLYNLDSVVGLSMHAGPGAWNDPDMLQVGNSHDLIHRGRERIHFGYVVPLLIPVAACTQTLVACHCLMVIENSEFKALFLRPF